MSKFDSEDMPIGKTTLGRVGSGNTVAHTFRFSPAMAVELKESAFYTGKKQVEIMIEAFELWKAANPLIK